MAELTNRQKLQLVSRANGIYSTQIKYLKRHLAALRLLILDKENIIKNVELRIDLGLLIKDDKQIKIPPSKNTVIFPKHLGDRAGAFYHKTLHENEDLLTEISKLWHKYSIKPSENIHYDQLVSTADRVALQKISRSSVCAHCHEALNHSQNQTCYLCGTVYHLKCIVIHANQDRWFCEACGPKWDEMMSMNEIDTSNQLVLYEGANEIYRQQLKSLQDDLAELRQTVQGKEEIIDDLFVQLGSEQEPSKSISMADDIEDTETVVEEYRRSMCANAQREVLRNIGLRRLMELQGQHRMIISGFWRTDKDILKMNVLVIIMELVLCFYSDWSMIRIRWE